MIIFDIFEDDTRIYSTIGGSVIIWYRLYDKSRMMGDYHVRFCERYGVEFLVPTRHCIVDLFGPPKNLVDLKEG